MQTDGATLEGLEEYVQELYGSLDAEVDLHGGRTQWAHALRLAILATEKEIEVLKS